MAGALLEMWWTFTPVFTVFAASFSSHLRPDGVEGSNVPAPPSGRRVYMVSSVTSPIEPREDVHVRDAGEVLLRPLREVQHGDLAVLFFSSCVAGLPAARLLKIDRIGTSTTQYGSAVPFSVNCRIADSSG